MNPSASSELIVNAQRVRAKFRNPSNAVTDDGIDLKRLRRGFFIRTGPVFVLSDIPVSKFVPFRKVKREAVTYSEPHDHPKKPISTSSSTSSLRKAFMVKQIVNHVAHAYGCSVTELTGSGRTANIVKPRHVALYLAKVMTQKSLPWVGRQFAGRDHTTVLHAVRKIQRLMLADDQFAADMAALECVIREQNP